MSCTSKSNKFSTSKSKWVLRFMIWNGGMENYSFLQLSLQWDTLLFLLYSFICVKYNAALAYNQILCLWHMQGLSLGHVESQPSHLTHQLQRYTRTHYLSVIEHRSWRCGTALSTEMLHHRCISPLLSTPRLRIQPSSPPPTHPSNHLFRQPNQSPPPGSAGMMQGHGRWFSEPKNADDPTAF